MGREGVFLDIPYMHKIQYKIFEGIATVTVLKVQIGKGERWVLGQKMYLIGRKNRMK
jgi:hypothetical protein